MDRAKKLKLAAAVAAIVQFEAENEAAQTTQQPAPPPALMTAALPLWALSGRQESMMTRSLWQRRIGRAA